MSADRRRLGLIAAAAVTAVAAAASAARAETVVATLDHFPGLSAHGAAAAWSSFDSSTRRYALTILRDGRITTASVPQRSVPFDVDLGLDSRRRLTAVYSRCTTEGGPSTMFTELDVMEPGRGCRIFRHTVGRRGERELRRLRSPGASDYTPSLSGSRIAFARRLRDGRIVVQVRRTSGSLERSLLSRDRLGDVDARITGIDLSGRIVAYGWRYERDVECPGDLSGGEAKYYLESEIWAERIGRRGRRLVARTCDGARVISVTSPSASGSAIAYLEHRRPAGGDALTRFIGRHRTIASGGQTATREMQADGRVLRYARTFFLREQLRDGEIVYEVVRIQ